MIVKLPEGMTWEQWIEESNSRKIDDEFLAQCEKTWDTFKREEKKQPFFEGYRPKYYFKDGTEVDSKLNKSLDEIGISIYDNDGNHRSLKDILDELGMICNE